MAGTKIEHSLADKARQLDEMQQRADKFQQFVKGAHKDMMSAGQQMMQFFQQFNQVLTGAGPGGAGAPGPVGMQTEQGRNFVKLVNENVQSAAAAGGAGRSPAEAILLSERVRMRNARNAGVGGALPPSAIFSQDEIAEANRQVIKDNLSRSVGVGQEERDANAEELRGWNKDPERRRRRTLVQEYTDRIARQADLKSRLLQKFPEYTELRDPLASRAVLSSEDRLRADQIAATGGPRHFRYDVTDVPEMMKVGQRFDKDRGGIEKRIESLRQQGGPNSELNRTIATALENMVRKMDVSQSRFTEAMQSFTRLSADPNTKTDSQEYKTALNELRHSIDDLTNSNQDLARVNKTAKELPGGGGGGGGGAARGLYESMRPYAQMAGAGLGVAAAATGLYMRTGIAIDQASLGAERRGAESRGDIGLMMSQQALATQDMTDPRNLFKYRADKIFNRQYRYIGQRPSDAFRAAMEEQTDAMRISRQQLLLGMGSAATGTVLGAGQVVGGGLMLGGGPLATGMGVGMMSGGANQMMGAVGQGLDTAANNRYLQLEQGGLEGSFVGRFYRGKDEAGRRAALLQGAAEADVTKDYLGAIDKLRESEINQYHSDDLMAAGERQRMVDVQQQGAVLVGEYAVRRGDLLNRLYGPATPNAALRAGIRSEDRAAALNAGEAFSEKAQQIDPKAIFARKRELRTQAITDMAMIQKAEKTPEFLMWNASLSWMAPDASMKAEIEKRRREFQAVAPQYLDAKDRLRNSREELAKLTLPGPEAGPLALEQAAERIVDGTTASAFDRERFKRAIGGVESAGDYSAANPLSSARGKYQMINSTRVAIEDRLGVARGSMLGGDKAAIDLQEKGMDLLVNDYQTQVRKLRSDQTIAAQGRVQKMSDMELAAGLHARGFGDFGTFLRTGMDPKAGVAGNTSVANYIDHFNRKMGMPTSPEVMALAGEQYNPATAMTSAAARLEMTPSELMGHMNMVTSVLGSRRRGVADATLVGRPLIGLEAGVDETSRLVQMGRSGLGDFQSLLGNVASLNRTVGGQDNTRNLESVLASAVQAGFDKSRTAQMFFQTTNEIAKSLNMTNVGMLSGFLGNASAAMSVTGVADERSMALAASGIQGYANYTAQKTGVVGALKAAQIFGAGATFGTGAATLSDIGAPQAQGMISELDSGNITSIQLKRLVDMNKGDTKKVRAMLAGTARGGNQLFESFYNGVIGGNAKAEFTEMERLRKAGNQEQADKVMQGGLARAHELGKFMGVGGESGEAWYLQQAGQANALDPAIAKQLIDQKVAGGMGVFTDPAKVNRQKYLDHLMRGLRNNTTGISQAEALKTFEETGGAVAISAGDERFRGLGITPDLVKSADKDPALKKAIDQTLQQTDRFELFRSAKMGGERFEGDAQLVKIAGESVVELSRMIGHEVKSRPTAAKTNLNGNTP